MIGWAFRQLVGWLAVVAVIAVVIANRGTTPLTRSSVDTGQASAGATATSAPASSPAAASGLVSAGDNSLVFKAAKNGYVTLDVAVNGTPLRMVVDTGATSVVLRKSDAIAAGIAGGLNYSAVVGTVNGRTRAAPIMLREVRIGQFEIDNVPAYVVDNLAMTSLLGQSFLTRLSSYGMRDGVLTMTW